jgi:hypothetical protein
MNYSIHIVILLFLFLSQGQTADIIHRYKVKINKDLSRLQVTARFADIPFYHLYAGSKSSHTYTKNVSLKKGLSNRVYNPSSYELVLHKNAANAEFSYEFDISSALGNGRRAAAYKVGDDIILPPDLWLWRPYELESNEYIEVEFELPAGINVSTPWEKISHNKYRLDHSPYNWPSALAFGSFMQDTVQVPGSVLRISFLDGDYKTSKKELRQWVKKSAKAVSMVYGRFPKKNVQVLLIPGEKHSEPVPFGMVVRGGGLSVQFFIDPSHPVEDFLSDWTSTHELNHSLLPYIDRDQMWLSEGLATYYQYVLMGRDGRLSAQETWQKLYNGFEKGKRNSSGHDVKYTAENMYRFHTYPYVYWSGAAMLFKIDVLLREKSNNTKSLDWVLKQINQNHITEIKTWSGIEMLNLMDDVSKTNLFTEAYHDHIKEKNFAVDKSFLAKLGITIKNDKVVLSDKAERAWIRKKIVIQGS